MTGKWAATNTLRGRHSIGCPAGRGARNLPGPCECGHDAALAVMEAALAALEASPCQHDLAEYPCDQTRGLPVDQWCLRCAALRAVREGK